MPEILDTLRARGVDPRHRTLMQKYAQAITSVPHTRTDGFGEIAAAMLGILITLVRVSVPPSEWRSVGQRLGAIIEHDLSHDPN